MRLTRQALRADWPLPPHIKQLALAAIVEFLDPRTERAMLASDRAVIMAARTLAVFSTCTLKQQALDLVREKLEGRTSEVPLADLVAEAEARAELRINERDDD